MKIIYLPIYCIICITFISPIEINYFTSWDHCVLCDVMWCDGLETMESCFWYHMWRWRLVDFLLNLSALIRICLIHLMRNCGKWLTLLPIRLRIYGYACHTYFTRENERKKTINTYNLIYNSFFNVIHSRKWIMQNDTHLMKIRNAFFSRSFESIVCGLRQLISEFQTANTTGIRSW